MNEPKVNIAIVGLGFGAEFIPIYQKHPHANMYAICQRSESDLNKVGDAFNFDPDRRYSSYEKLLEDPVARSRRELRPSDRIDLFGQRRRLGR